MERVVQGGDPPQSFDGKSQQLFELTDCRLDISVLILDPPPVEDVTAFGRLEFPELCAPESRNWWNWTRSSR